MQRPVSALTVLSKRKTGRPVLDLEDAALLSGQVGDLFKFTRGNHECANSFLWLLLDSMSCSNKSQASQETLVFGFLVWLVWTATLCLEYETNASVQM